MLQVRDKAGSAKCYPRARRDGEARARRRGGFPLRVATVHPFETRRGSEGPPMNLEKFTDRAKGFLQAAQTVAVRLNHQRITPEHLLKALLEDSEGMASGLIQRAGGDAKAAVDKVDAALPKLPGVPGSGA